MTSSKWPHRQPVNARNWRRYWHRRVVGACGEVKTSWFHVGRALAWGKACGGSHHVVAIYTSFWLAQFTAFNDSGALSFQAP